MNDDFAVGNYDEMEPSEYTPIPPGNYHLAVSAVNPHPMKKSGEAVNGLELTFEVEAGTVEGQAKKTFRETFYWPSPANKDGGAFLAKRLGRLATVLKVAAPGQKFGQVAWAEMAARHFVATLLNESYKGDNGKEFVSTKIDGLKMWHVASPHVANVPKDAEVLELAPMGEDPFTSQGDGGAGAPAPAPKPIPAPVASPAPASDPYANL